MALAAVKHSISLFFSEILTSPLGLWTHRNISLKFTRLLQLPRTLVQLIPKNLTPIINRRQHYRILEQISLRHSQTLLQETTDPLLLRNLINSGLLNHIQTGHSDLEEQGIRARSLERAHHQDIKHLSLGPMIRTPTLLNMQSEPHICGSPELSPPKEEINEILRQEQEARRWVYTDAFLQGKIFTREPPEHTLV